MAVLNEESEDTTLTLNDSRVELGVGVWRVPGMRQRVETTGLFSGVTNIPPTPFGDAASTDSSTSVIISAPFGESTNGQPLRGWPALWRPHFLQWRTLPGVVLAETVVVAGDVGTGRDEGRMGATVKRK